MRDLTGKVVVLTGAADGIGRALADELAAAGARLVLADVDQLKLDEVRRQLVERGTDVMAQATDVAKPTQVCALRDAALDRFGTVDILCNNAGVMGPAGDPLWELPFGEWERVIATNVWGVLHGIQAFVPPMLAAGHEGHVLNTASMQGMTAGALIPEYTVSKHAVVALSEALRAQLVARNAPIGVTVLCPGAVSTQLASREHERLAARGEQWAVGPGGSGDRRDWGQALTPAEVATAAVEGIRNQREYVFTHPGSRARVDARLRPILDALDAAESGGPAAARVDDGRP